MVNSRLAFRALLKTPFVTGVAVASVALGSGANSAIFSLFNALLLAPAHRTARVDPMTALRYE